MTDEQSDDEQNVHGEQEDEDDAPESAHPVLRSALDAFQQQQRLLASFDFSALAGVHDAIARSGIMHAVEDIQKSVNFTAMQDVAQSMDLASQFVVPPVVQPEVLQQLAATIDLSAIQRANDLILGDAAIWDASRKQAEEIAAITAKFDYSALVEQFTSALAGINWDQLREAFERWLPSNLRSVSDLDDVARIALDEGLPLAWVPRREVLEELLVAPNQEKRLRILEAHADDILNDCESVLQDIAPEWGNQCRSAISALRHGLEAPAQSHAGNIVDSIIYAVLGSGGRDKAKQRAQEDSDDLPIQVAMENLVLRPLFLGFIRWFPGQDDPIPDHFARHATAHAVGQPGVFSRTNALIAVMLATSLTVQFWDDPTAP